MLKHKKWTALLAGMLAMALLATGCNLFAEESKAPAPKKQVKKETVKKLPITPIEWTNGLPAPQKTGGVYLFTKQNHPLEMAYSFHWNKNDALLVQINASHARGHELDVLAVEQLKPDRIRIVVKLTPGKDAGNPKAAPASRYVELKRGVIQRQDMTFVVVDEKGEEVPLN